MEQTIKTCRAARADPGGAMSRKNSANQAFIKESDGPGLVPMCNTGPEGVAMPLNFYQAPVLRVLRQCDS